MQTIVVSFCSLLKCITYKLKYEIGAKAIDKFPVVMVIKNLYFYIINRAKC